MLSVFDFDKTKNPFERDSVEYQKAVHAQQPSEVPEEFGEQSAPAPEALKALNTADRIGGLFARIAKRLGLFKEED